MEKILVIGSGASGVHFTLSVLKKGYEVTLIDVGWEIVDGRLTRPAFEKRATVCVYIVPDGYPTNPKRDTKVVISPPHNSELYFASVHEEGGVIRTTGSRSIALLAKGETVAEAKEKVYSDVPLIRGDLFYRKDIATGVGEPV